MVRDRTIIGTFMEFPVSDLTALQTFGNNKFILVNLTGLWIPVMAIFQRSTPSSNPAKWARIPVGCTAVHSLLVRIE